MKTESVKDIVAQLAETQDQLANCHQQDRLKTNEINVLVQENRTLAKQVEIREKALRDIKALHTRWYHKGDHDPGYVINTMEEIAVSVWQREGTDPVICKACGCKVDVHGCGCNPHDA